MNITKKQIVDIAAKFGYAKTRDKNGSFYFEQFLPAEGERKSKFIKIRFSDHFLGERYGEAQTANATCDISEWGQDSLTAEQVEGIFRFPEIGGDFQCASFDEVIAREGGIDMIREYCTEVQPKL